MKRRTSGLVGIGIAWLLLVAAPAAWAQEEPAPDPAPAPAPAPDVSTYSDSGFGMDVSAYGIMDFGWALGFGGGAQFAYPVVPNGFIPNPRFRDALHVEGGLDFTYFFWDTPAGDFHMAALNLMAGARYAVYVLDKLAPFATLKLGAAIPTVTGGPRYDPGVYFYFLWTVGVLYDLNEVMSLRAETGYEYVGDSAGFIRVGVLFRL